ncbi:fibroleukin-like [Ylistrum balloti]|uniref:fibroleukin-like n=1 Tax=Ylistrum balloti TaxID=509963 RepID=UPI002905E2EE|nr:fibroleukin-like [Ylistrum balloti]
MPYDDSESLVDCGDISCVECSGVYRITPVPGTSFDVFCDVDTFGGPWTVIQRRFDGSVNFTRNWEDYKRGFGTPYGEYWLGEHGRLHEGWNGTMGYATYRRFIIGSEADNYQLTIGGFDGDVGDKFTQHSGHYFSTFDRDNDQNRNRHCAEFGGGGWWYRNCYGANLNGVYLEDNGTDVRYSMNWEYFYPERRQAPLRNCTLMVKRK